MVMDKQPPSESRPGRKRSEESRIAILVAAFELVGEVGYAGLTIEGIANRAGCGKQTIYRWWPSKAHVLLEALAVKADLYVTNADHCSYTDDLRAFLGDTFRLGRQQRVVDILRVLMAEAQINEEFGELFRSAFLQRRRDALQVVLDRARTRGDLPPRPAESGVLDIVFGTLWYRLLATRQPMGDDLVEDLTATLTGAAPPPSNTAIDLGDQQ
ncbi:TetR/AcrR family transcriptional regulator [Kitasatospora sp. NPDC050463]|uniref:TetR/AcrR family transcriptional regulator n=1 Tax=Kitasatospora sp. NPDC050463 TaxID=3155786 RepID=UPI0033E5185F